MATPGMLLVTSRSPIWIGARSAFTLTFTRPVVATSALFGPPSPRITPGFADTTPATRVSYARCEALTELVRSTSRLTTVPAPTSPRAEVHSAMS